MDLFEIFRVDVIYFENIYLVSLKKSRPVAKYGRFSSFKKRFCPWMFSETVKDGDLIFRDNVFLALD